MSVPNMLATCPNVPYCHKVTFGRKFENSGCEEHSDKLILTLKDKAYTMLTCRQKCVESVSCVDYTLSKDSSQCSLYKAGCTKSSTADSNLDLWQAPPKTNPTEVSYKCSHLARYNADVEKPVHDHCAA